MIRMTAISRINRPIKGSKGVIENIRPKPFEQPYNEHSKGSFPSLIPFMDHEQLTCALL